MVVLADAARPAAQRGHAPHGRRLNEYWKFLTASSLPVLLNRPGVSGEFIRWKDDLHGTSLVVSGGAAAARDPDGR